MDKKLVICVLLVALLVGCAGEEYKYKLPDATKAENLTPEIPGSTKFDATKAVTVVTGAAGFTVTKSPEPVTQIIGRVATFAACMQAKGAAIEIGYYDLHLNNNNELNISFAAVGIGDKKEMTDFGNLATCFVAASKPLSFGQLGSGPVSLCSEKFTIKSDTNEFFVQIVGIFDTSSGDSCKKVKNAMLANAKTLEK
jgi:hypothetical protein